jgi:hypothetical protein
MYKKVVKRHNTGFELTEGHVVQKVEGSNIGSFFE